MKLFFKNLLILGVFFCSTFSTTLKSQVLDVKDDVMLQGFYWNSYQNAGIVAEGGLYNYLKARVPQYAAAKFDVIWTPPPSKGDGMAYFPTELFKFNNSHGAEVDLRSLMTSIKAAGMHGMCDIVINHRSGTTKWADFTNPVWGCDVLAANDEVAGQAGQVQPCSGKNDEGEGFPGSRDILHSNATVQKDIKAYLAKLKDIGFDSWRYDFTKGYPAKYVGEYNASSAPYASVGEYLDGNIGLLTNWVNASGNTISGTTTKSTSFDFSLFYILDRAVKGSYSELNNGGGMPGLAGTFGFADKAITFAENHDVHNIAGNDNIMKANAYILTHPGIPMVFLPHFEANQLKISELIATRKQNKISAWSSISITNSSSFYSAFIDGKVAVKIGPGTWDPGAGWILNTFGTDYAVWSKSTINIEPIIAISPLATTFGVGSTQPITITASDDKAGYTIYYTTDGSTPTAASQVYSAPVNVSTTTTVKAIVKDSEGLFSEVATQTYTFVTTGDITVKVKPPTSWVAPIKVHHFEALPSANLANSSWPGKVMTGPDANGYYSYTFTNIASTNIIFTRGANGSPQTQDADIKRVTENTCYNMSTWTSGLVPVETCVTLGVNDSEFKSSQLKIFPNPTSGAFKLNTTISNLSIFDITGKVVKQFNGTFQSDATFDVNNLVKGMYFVKVKSIDGIETTLKLSKE